MTLLVGSHVVVRKRPRSSTDTAPFDGCSVFFIPFTVSLHKASHNKVTPHNTTNNAHLGRFSDGTTTPLCSFAIAGIGLLCYNERLQFLVSQFDFSPLYIELALDDSRSVLASGK